MPTAPRAAGRSCAAPSVLRVSRLVRPRRCCEPSVQNLTRYAETSPELGAGASRRGRCRWHASSFLAFSLAASGPRHYVSRTLLARTFLPTRPLRTAPAAAFGYTTGRPPATQRPRGRPGTVAAGTATAADLLSVSHRLELCGDVGLLHAVPLRHAVTRPRRCSRSALLGVPRARCCLPGCCRQRVRVQLAALSAAQQLYNGPVACLAFLSFPVDFRVDFCRLPLDDILTLYSSIY